VCLGQNTATQGFLLGQSVTFKVFIATYMPNNIQYSKDKDGDIVI